jgi:selenoprotein W-related protein
MNEKPLPAVRITYCTQCGWLLRAGWMAQELLSTFGMELGEVVLVPGSGGVFRLLRADCASPGGRDTQRRSRV